MTTDGKHRGQPTRYSAEVHVPWGASLARRGCLDAEIGGCSTYRTTAEEKRQFDALQAKWGSRLVKRDRTSKLANDYNPIIHVPIQGL